MLPHQLSAQEWSQAGLSQLRMRRSLPEDPPSRPVPGYVLRAYRPGDEAAWVEILNTGDFGPWDHTRLERMLGGERAPLPLEGAVFATHAGMPVGAACAFHYEDAEGPYAELGWVAVRPEHRGRGLSYEICRAVLQFTRRSGSCYTYLKTEDLRLAAIKTYLRLGFEPELLDDTHPARWREIRRALGYTTGG